MARKAVEHDAKLEKGTHVQVEGELRYREYEKEYGTKKAPRPVKHRVAEIHINRILKLDRAEKQDELAPEVDPSELPADEPTS
jgi:single-stranded DNA-binding protein